MKLKGMSNKKVRTRDPKRKNNKSGIIPLQYKYNFKIRLKKHIKQ